LIKERAGCRNVIVRERLRPGFLYDTFPGGLRVRALRAGEVWDGLTAMVEGDWTLHSLTPAMRRQMKKMLKEGFWPEGLHRDPNSVPLPCPQHAGCSGACPARPIEGEPEAGLRRRTA
jgi:hypothetical protein